MTGAQPEAGPPPDPREERYRPLGDFLLAEIIAVALLALLALATEGDLSRRAGVGMVSLLVLIPLVRVLWLGVRWFRRGDRRYALVAAGVLVAPVLAFVLSH